MVIWKPGCRCIRGSSTPVDGHEAGACRCPRIDADEAVDVVAAAQPATAGEHQLDSGLAGRQAVSVGTQRCRQVGVHEKSPFTGMNGIRRKGTVEPWATRTRPPRTVVGLVGRARDPDDLALA